MVMHVVFVAHGRVTRTEVWLDFLISKQGHGFKSMSDTNWIDGCDFGNLAVLNIYG